MTGTTPVSRGLLIKSPHIERILMGRKDWEMRSKSTRLRECIGLIRSGSGQVVGTADIVDCVGPFDRAGMLANMHRHHLDRAGIEGGLYDKWRYGWVLANARPLARPIRYVHSPGAVIFVALEDDVCSQIAADRLSARP
jgi:hypothetical protein